MKQSYTKKNYINADNMMSTLSQKDIQQESPLIKTATFFYPLQQSQQQKKEKRENSKDQSCQTDTNQCKVVFRTNVIRKQSEPINSVKGALPHSESLKMFGTKKTQVPSPAQPQASQPDPLLSTQSNQKMMITRQQLPAQNLKQSMRSLNIQNNSPSQNIGYKYPETTHATHMRLQSDNLYYNQQPLSGLNSGSIKGSMTPQQQPIISGQTGSPSLMNKATPLQINGTQNSGGPLMRQNSQPLNLNFSNSKEIQKETTFLSPKASSSQINLKNVITPNPIDISINDLQTFNPFFGGSGGTSGGGGVGTSEQKNHLGHPQPQSQNSGGAGGIINNNSIVNDFQSLNNTREMFGTSKQLMSTQSFNIIPKQSTIQKLDQNMNIQEDFKLPSINQMYPSSTQNNIDMGQNQIFKSSLMRPKRPNVRPDSQNSADAYNLVPPTAFSHPNEEISTNENTMNTDFMDSSDGRTGMYSDIKRKAQTAGEVYNNNSKYYQIGRIRLDPLFKDGVPLVTNNNPTGLSTVRSQKFLQRQPQVKMVNRIFSSQNEIRKDSAEEKNRQSRETLDNNSGSNMNKNNDILDQTFQSPKFD